MPSGVVTREGPRSHVLHGGPVLPQEGALLMGHVPAHCNVPTHECIAHWSSRDDETTMRPFVKLLWTLV